MTHTLTDPHWAESIDVDGLHEPTVRAIIDTMKRTGARFAAHVLECQYSCDQVKASEGKAKRIRDIADLVEAHPLLPIIVEGSADWWPLNIMCDDVEDMHSKRRAIGGKWKKEVNDYYFTLTGRTGDAYVKLSAPRDAVCERVVVGTETKLVADPDAPKVEIEVDVVEWICPDAILGEVE